MKSPYRAFNENAVYTFFMVCAALAFLAGAYWGRGRS